MLHNIVYEKSYLNSNLAKSVTLASVRWLQNKAAKMILIPLIGLKYMIEHEKSVPLVTHNHKFQVNCESDFVGLLVGRLILSCLYTCT